MKRPVSYKDWRSLFQSEAKELGWHIAFLGARGLPLDDRVTWKAIRRLKRIQDRLELEWKVMDSSWCEAMLESLREE